MLILFAVGVVTGTILSFELGLLWPNFMATFGEVFGLAFGLEGFSFFIEAIFIAIYVYGWDRLPPRAHFLAGLPIVVAGFTGSLFVLAVNGWMNHPTGFDIVDGRGREHPAVGGAVQRLPVARADPHVLRRLHGRRVPRRRRLRGGLAARRPQPVRAHGLAVPLTIAALVAPAQVVVGDWAARDVAAKQPIKLATFEGLGPTTAGAPFHIGGWYEADTGEVRGAIAIPKLLSVLAAHDPNATIAGLESVPPERPAGPGQHRPLRVPDDGRDRHAAGDPGSVLRGGVVAPRAPAAQPLVLPLVVAAGPLALVALLSGWITTEVGRQPWIVYEVMRVEDAVTAADGLPLAFAGAVVVYVALAATVVWLLRRLARRPPETEVEGPVNA